MCDFGHFPTDTIVLAVTVLPPREGGIRRHALRKMAGKPTSLTMISSAGSQPIFRIRT